jgi:RNA polymerase sigma factor (sigma-70 family)
MQTPDPSNTLFIKTVNNYTDLIKTVARIEYSRLSLSTHIIDYVELVNIGATAIYVVLSSQPTFNHTDAYLATAIKWAIRNEYRKRYKWYSCKYLSKEFDEVDEEDEELNENNIREAIYETIFSIEELAEANNPVQIEDTDFTPDQRIEVLEMNRAIREAMKELPPKERLVLELRFYKNKRVKEIAAELNVTSSRITRIIQTGLDRIKFKLQNEEFI